MYCPKCGTAHLQHMYNPKHGTVKLIWNEIEVDIIGCKEHCEEIKKALEKVKETP